jgi:hypothetical protein
VRSLLLVPWVLAASSPSQAAPPYKDSTTAVLVRAADAGGERLAGALEARLGAALVAREVDVVDLGALYPPPPPASLAPAERLFAEGKEAFDNLDPETAHARFTEAVEVYVRHPVETPAEQLARVLTFLGANALMEGHKDRALDAFRWAATLAPGLEPESELFGPEVYATYGAAQASLEGKAPVPLAISSLPSGARAVVGGKDLGITPLQILQVPPGRHHLVLTRPGFVPFGAFAEVGETSAQVRPVLTPTEGLAETLELAEPLHQAADAVPGPASPQAKQLRQRLGARFLVLAQVTSSEDGAATGRVQIQDVETGNKLTGLTVVLDDADWSSTMELAERLRAFIASPPPPPSRLAFDFQAPPLLRKWWFWAAVGGTVAASAGVYAVGRAGASRPDFVVGVP